MTVFVAVARFQAGGRTEVPAACIAALALPGAGRAAVFECDGFACAAAPTRADSGLAVADGCVTVGDVRLDAAAELHRSLRVAAPLRLPFAAAPVSVVTPHVSLPAAPVSVVAAAFAAWGDATPGRLRGDFSFVHWDPKSRQLTAARDGMGVRPLYYATIAGGVVMSNALDAVRAHPLVSPAINGPAVVSFLDLGWNADTTTTTFTAIARLAPGTALVGTASAHRVVRHWIIPDPEPLTWRHDAEYLERYTSLLGAAVADRLEPSGTVLFLSGGIDSTTIAASARRVAPSARLTGVTFRHSAFESLEESRLASQVASHIGLSHTLIELDPVALGPRRRHTPEPHDDAAFGSLSETLAGLAPLGGVLIEGEDGDALFRPPGLASMLRRDPPLTVAARVAGFTFRHGYHPYLGFWLRRRLAFWRRAAADARAPWLSAHAAKIAPAHEALRPAHRARPEAAASLTASIWQSVQDGADRAYHGAPVEYRWPLLDSRLIEFVFAIPPIPWCQRKYLARRAFADELPSSVIARKKTTIPGHFEWLVDDWRRRTGASFAPLHERTREYVSAQRLADTFRAGDTEQVMAGWRALELDAWFREEER